MGKSVTSRAFAPTLDRRMRATAIIVGAVVVAGLAVAAWLGLAPLPDAATAPPQAVAPAPLTGPDADAPAVDGSEVLPADETPQRPDRIPPIAPAAARVTLPLPASATAQGELVAGFPADLAAPAEDSDVLDSTIASEGDTMQFTLRARSDASADAVLAHYAAAWAALGLAPSPSAQGVSYGDAYSSLSVVAESTGTGLVYTVYGVLRAV